MKAARKTALLLFALEYIPIAGGLAWVFFAVRLFFPMPILSGILHNGAFVVGLGVLLVGNYLVAHYVAERAANKILGWIFWDRAVKWADQKRADEKAEFQMMQEKREGK